MAFKPLQDRVLVKPVEEEKSGDSLIIVPDTAKDQPNRGKVVAVGEGRILDDGTKIPVGVKEGDLVLFSGFGGTEIKLEGEVHKILTEAEIFGVHT